MALSKEGANLPVFAADSSEELQDKWGKTRGAVLPGLGGLTTGSSIKLKKN